MAYLLGLSISIFVLKTNAYQKFDLIQFDLISVGKKYEYSRLICNTYNHLHLIVFPAKTNFSQFAFNQTDLIVHYMKIVINWKTFYNPL